MGAAGRAATAARADSAGCGQRMCVPSRRPAADNSWPHGGARRARFSPKSGRGIFGDTTQPNEGFGCQCVSCRPTALKEFRNIGQPVCPKEDDGGFLRLLDVTRVENALNECRRNEVVATESLHPVAGILCHFLVDPLAAVDFAV